MYSLGYEINNGSKVFSNHYRRGVTARLRKALTSTPHARLYNQEHFAFLSTFHTKLKLES